MRKTSLFIFTIVLLSVTRAEAYATNLILNGGFENGVYTAGNGNPYVPVAWTAATPFIYGSGDYDGTGIYGAPHSGSYNLSIGNFDYQASTIGLASISQTFSDTAGQAYNGVFYVYYGAARADANAFFRASIDATTMVSLTDTTGNTYVAENFSFTGTGSDTLTFSAQTNPSEWMVDDVSISSASGAIPEPSTWALMMVGFAGLGFASYHRTRVGRSDHAA
jgi:hypothetical protein